MLESFNILDTCGGLETLVRLIKFGVMPLFQIVIPILLILFASIDLGKAVISSDDKEVKAAQGRLIKRCIYAVLIFFVFTIVTLVMGLVGTSGEEGSNSWSACWDDVKLTN